MNLDRKLIRKMILKELRQLNEDPLPDNVLAYGSSGGKEEARSGLKKAALFFDKNRKGGMQPAGTNDFSKKLCRELMSLCGNISSLLAEEYEHEDLKYFASELDRVTKKILEIVNN